MSSNEDELELKELISVEFAAEIFFLNKKTRIEAEYLKKNAYRIDSCLGNRLRLSIAIRNVIGISVEQNPLKNKIMRDGCVLSCNNESRERFRPILNKSNNTCGCLDMKIAAYIVMPYIWMSLIISGFLSYLGYAYYLSNTDVAKYTQVVKGGKKYYNFFRGLIPTRLSFYYNCFCGGNGKEPKYKKVAIVRNGKVLIRYIKRVQANETGNANASAGENQAVNNQTDCPRCALELAEQEAQAQLPEIDTPSSSNEENNMLPPINEENIVPSPTNEENDVLPTINEENIMSTPTNDENVTSPTIEENDVLSPINEENIVLSPRNEENDMLPTINEENIMSTPTNDENVTSPTIEENVTSPTIEENDMLPPINEENIVPSPTNEENVTSPTIEENDMLPPINEENIISTPTNDENVANEEIYILPFSNDEDENDSDTDNISSESDVTIRNDSVNEPYIY